MDRLSELFTENTKGEASRAALEAVPSLPLKCVEAMRADEDSARAGLRLIMNVALADGLEVALFKTPGLTEALMRAATLGETNDIRERALGVIQNLASASDIKMALFATPGLVDALVLAAGSGRTHIMKQRALGALQNLASANQNKVAMRHCPGLVNVLVLAAGSGETALIKHRGLGVLLHLSAAFDNRVPLMQTLGLVGTLLQAATTAATEGIQAAALGTLAGLAGAPENRLALAQTPGLVALLVSDCSSANDDCRKHAACALHNLAQSPESAAIIDTPAVLDALSQRLHDEHSIVQQLGAMALAVLVGSDPARSRVLASHPVVLLGLVDTLRRTLDHATVFAPLEPLLAVHALSLLPGSRTLFVSAELPSLLARTLASALGAGLAPLAFRALATLQQLAFDSPARLKADTALPSLLERTSAQSEAAWREARRAAQYLAFQLETGGGSDDDSASPASAVTASDVSAAAATTDDEEQKTMDDTVRIPKHATERPSHARNVVICCARENQELAGRIGNYLVARDCVVWHTNDNAAPDLVHAMTRAMLDAELVIGIVSKALYMSAPCRIELEFAERKGRSVVPVVADDFDVSATWLGALVGEANAYALSFGVDAALMQLFAMEIDAGTRSSSSASRTLSTEPSPAVAGSGGATANAPATKEAVLAWLASADLADFYPALEREGFGGKRFGKLKGLPPTELGNMFKLNNADAVDLFDALKEAAW